MIDVDALAVIPLFFLESSLKWCQEVCLYIIMCMELHHCLLQWYERIYFFFEMNKCGNDHWPWVTCGPCSTVYPPKTCTTSIRIYYSHGRWTFPDILTSINCETFMPELSSSPASGVMHSVSNRDWWLFNRDYRLLVCPWARASSRWSHMCFGKSSHIPFDFFPLPNVWLPLFPPFPCISRQLSHHFHMLP